MPRRPDQVASLIQRAVQAVLGRGLGDPRIRGLVSVTKVRLDHALSFDAALAEAREDDAPEETGP